MSGNKRIPELLLLTSFLTGMLSLNSCTKDPTLPVLNTSPATEITENSAKISGEITDNGRAEVTARGFCWGISANPTIADDFIPSGTGSGIFSGTIEGLEPNNNYHVRAYAENSVGIAYGNEIEFLTSTAAPAVTTKQVTNITATAAVCGGSNIYDGGGTITARGVCWSTTPDPDLGDFHTTDGTGTDNYTSTITNLSSGTIYYVRAYAINSKLTVYGAQLAFITKAADIEGNLYNTVKIGTEVWMAENLRATKLNDNTQIPNIPDTTLWVGTSAPAYCWYNNDIAYRPTYGALYNWYTVSTEKLCPGGWHVPTDAEFNALEQALGMAADQFDVWGWRGTDHGTKMKNTSGWDENGNGTNSSGFSALPGGYRFGVTGEFFLQTTITYWWSATEHDVDRGWYRRLDSSSEQVYRASTSKKGGKYIRCKKD